MRCILIGYEKDTLRVELREGNYYCNVLYKNTLLFSIRPQKFHTYGQLGLFIDGDRALWFHTAEKRAKFLSMYEWVYNPLAQGGRV